MFIHNRLTSPQIERRDTPEGRFYVTPEGNSYESVTNFLARNSDKKWLENWKKRVGEEAASNISYKATNRGTMLHSLAEQYLLNSKSLYKDINPLTKGLFIKIRPLLDRINNILLLEDSLYSDELKLAGTPDVVADFDNVLSVIDFKGSTKEKLKENISNYFLQTSSYAIMCKERFNLMPEKLVIIMAVENSPQPLLFEENTGVWITIFKNFMEKMK